MHDLRLCGLLTLTLGASVCAGCAEREPPGLEADEFAIDSNERDRDSLDCRHAYAIRGQRVD